MPLSRCIDMSMYPMGKGKLLRIENIRRRNGRYKVPVRWDELTEMPVDDLLALTAHPRQVELADPRIPVLQSKYLTELFLRCQVAVHAGSRSRNQSGTRCSRTLPFLVQLGVNSYIAIAVPTLVIPLKKQTKKSVMHWRGVP